MDEFKENPQGGELEDGGQESVVGSSEQKTETGTGTETRKDGAETEDQQDDAGGSKSEAEGADKAGDGGRQEDEAREHEINNRMKAARLAGEKAAAERTRREIDEGIKAQQIPDPYHPGKFFLTYDELVAYGRRQRADARKVPVEDIERDDKDREYIRKKREEDDKAAKERQAQAAMAAFIEADAKDFALKYPELDPAKLEKDARFLEFAGSRLYREPLAKLYAGYIKLVGDAGKAAVERKKDKDERSTGSGAGSGNDALTPAQQKALKEWNEANPAMKMTAKEFLDR